MALSVLDLPWLPEPPGDFSSLCRALDAASPDTAKEIQRLATHRLNPRQSLALGRAVARVRGAGTPVLPLATFRLGLLANGTVDLVNDCLAAACARHGVALELLTAPYDQVAQQALDPGSQINTAKPDAVLVMVEHHWLGLDKVELSKTAADRVQGAIQQLRGVIEGLRAHSGAPAILQTVPVPPQALFGNMDRRMPASMRGLMDSLNKAIAELAAETGSYLLDTAALAERVGADRWFDPVQWVSYKIPFSAECAPIYADTLGRLIGAIRGKARKCLVLDLDNTLWGGVIGDDGMDGIKIGQGNAKGEAFLALQQAALELRERGVFLAVCSKNDDATARRPFREHTEMLLREEHISVFQANWIDKPSNLESIAKALNIGLDALVFFDDNPAERAQVRAALPQVAVPEIPLDPSWYAWTLGAAGYFEAVSFSAEDGLRVSAVAADAKRAEVMSKSRDLGDYLTSLDMTISFASFDENGQQRITQLINKTNQFNLTTRRYTDAEVAAMRADPLVNTLQVRLKDRFGDLGMIGVVICKPAPGAAGCWEIDTWLMSCRVLGRDVEQAMLQEVVRRAAAAGIGTLLGYYVPTPKNGMVAEHYKKLGFELVESGNDGSSAWMLRIPGYKPRPLAMKLDGETAAVVLSGIDMEQQGETADANAEPEALSLIGVLAQRSDPVGRRPGAIGRREALREGAIVARAGEFLVKGRPDRALALAARMMPDAAEAERVLPLLLRAFSAAGEQDLLLDQLLARSKEFFTKLSLARLTGTLAAELSRNADFERAVDEAVQAGVVPSFKLMEGFNGSVGRPIMRTMLKLKYSGLNFDLRSKEFFDIAAKLSERVSIDAGPLRFLFQHSRAGHSSYEDWVGEVRLAYAIEFMMRDGEFLSRRRKYIFDDDSKRLMADFLGDERNAIYLVHHCGFGVLRTELFVDVFEDGMLLAGVSRDKRYIPVKGDARTALFTSLKCLQKNKPLYVAPDAQLGQSRAKVEVFGRSITIGTGAAFLAYEAKSRVIWLSIRKDKGRFVPHLVEGPRREKGETYESFLERFVGFYNQMLDAYFSGPPGDLVLKPLWLKTFHE